MFTAEIVYNDNLSTSANDHSIELYYDGGSVTFNMITSGTSSLNEFLQESNVDTTAINLNNAINNYTDSDSNIIFSAEIDTVNKKIIVRTTSNSDISLVNNSITGDGFTSITNFLHEIYYKNFETELVYNNDIATSINEHSVELYYDETNSVTFDMITSGIPSSTEFLQQYNSNVTAINLKNAIDAHPNFTEAIVNTDRIVYTFGDNEYGKLGLGDNTDRNTPTEITDLNATNIIAVSCGRYHTAIVKSDGTVYTFGWNYYGALGLGTNGYSTSKSTPTLITDPNITDVIAVSCGGNHTAILKSDGTVYTCGKNVSGELGLGHSGYSNDINTPTEIYGNHTDVIAISCGRSHTAILKSDGSVYTFGGNSSGQLGLGDSGWSTNRNTPTLITDPNITDIIEVSCGDSFTAILKSDGTVYTCGYNYYGQLGLGTSGFTNRITPTQIQGHEDVIAVSCGDQHTEE